MSTHSEDTVIGKEIVLRGSTDPKKTQFNGKRAIIISQKKPWIRVNVYDDANKATASAIAINVAWKCNHYDVIPSPVPASVPTETEAPPSPAAAPAPTPTTTKAAPSVKKKEPGPYTNTTLVSRDRSHLSLSRVWVTTKLICFNVQHSNHLFSIDLCLHEDADLFTLSEVIPAHGRGFESLLGDHGRTCKSLLVESKLAIFMCFRTSRYKQLLYRNKLGEEMPGFLGSTLFGYMYTILQDTYNENKTFLWISVHLPYRVAQKRKTAITALMALIKEMRDEWDPHLPIIMCGDFNRSYAQLKEEFKELNPTFMVHKDKTTIREKGHVGIDNVMFVDYPINKKSKYYTVTRTKGPTPPITKSDGDSTEEQTQTQTIATFPKEYDHFPLVAHYAEPRYRSDHIYGVSVPRGGGDKSV